MAYDLFVAICQLLHYLGIMNSHFCVFLVSVSFLFSFVDSQMHNLVALQFTDFKDVEIGNLFCHPSQLLNLACSDSFTDNIVMYIGVDFPHFENSFFLLLNHILYFQKPNINWEVPSFLYL
jgi:olfactory receptor